MFQTQRDGVLIYKHDLESEGQITIEMINGAFKRLTCFESMSKIDQIDEISSINALEERQYHLSSTSDFDQIEKVVQTTLTEDCYSLREILTDPEIFSKSQQRLAVLKADNQPDKFLMMTRNNLNFNKKECSIVNFTDLTAVRQVSSL